MSGVFIFAPEAHAYTMPPHAGGYSPFVPDASVFPPSPNIPPASPHFGNPSPHFATAALPTAPVMFPSAEEPWAPPQPIQRRGSWHGGVNPMNSSGLLFAPVNPGHHRSNSFGHMTAPAPVYVPPANLFINWNPNSNSPWYAPVISLPPTETREQVHLHPWLNGESFRHEFIFNLSHGYFTPARAVGHGQTVALGPNELSQLAVWPPVHKLTIVHDTLPQWPIEVTPTNAYPAQHSPYYAPPSPTGRTRPVTVGDVLWAIHKKLHERISQSDFNSLSRSDEAAVVDAFNKRCKSLGQQMYGIVRADGVKKVDFLQGKTWFKGLVKTGASVDHLKILSSAGSGQ